MTSGYLTRQERLRTFPSPQKVLLGAVLEGLWQHYSRQTLETTQRPISNRTDTLSPARSYDGILRSNESELSTSAGGKIDTGHERKKAGM